MLKIFLLVFLVPAIQCTDNGRIQEFEDVYSNHLDLSTSSRASVQLTPNEMKLFIGHARNLVKSNCPSVDSQKLFLLQNYIAKRLTLLGPVKSEQGQEMYLAKVIENMQNYTTNSKSSVVSSVSSVSTPTLPVEFIIKPDPFVRIMYHGEPTEKSIPKTKESTSKPSGGLEVLSAPTPPAEDGVRLYAGEPKVVALPPASVHNFNLGDWFSQTWHTDTSFFSNAFANFGFYGTGGPVTVNAGDEVILPSVKRVVIEGKQGFVSLFDELCNIYCKCPQPYSTAFKIGAIEVVKFLFNDQKSAETAAKFLIDEKLIEEMQKCVA